MENRNTETEGPRPPKKKLKKKLKLFKVLTAVFAVLFVLTIAVSAYFTVSFSKRITYLETQLNDTRSEISSAINEKLSLENQLSELTAENDDLNRKYNQLNSDTQTFQSTITELQNQLTQIQEENADLKSDIETVNNQVSTLRNTNSSLTEKNKSLSSQISSLNSTITTLQNENAALRASIESIGGTIPEEGGSDDEDEEIINGSSSVETTPTKIAYLTFDDGVSKYTDEILDILAKYNIKATFFPNWKSGNNEKYQRMVNEGHAVGNHTYSHEYEDVYSTLDGFISEITKLNDKITAVTGYTPEIFRFPGGSSNTVHKKYNTEIIQQGISALKDLGMEYYDWNVNSGDADDPKGASKDTIVKNVLSRATMDKAVILMHDTNTKGTTVAALPEIIEGLIDKGYTFGLLTDSSAPVVQYVKPQS